ncbi:hypothetical protein SBX37_21330 [Vibrio mangrovi]|uniref:PHP domain protein n=1 Tax=Vibrio mangrovi TaxID=474394 RepID=A0ABU4ICG6_9VIBR|nr:hypothetical protein [Vibrio mangrovi]MDW6005416.1 hypothetical protein [Vibrio mangrovi]
MSVSAFYLVFVPVVVSAQENSISPYSRLFKLRGDLHIHSKTASFDSICLSPGCRSFSASEQFTEAYQAGLDFAAVTEHLRHPLPPYKKASEQQWHKVIASAQRYRPEDMITFYGYEWGSSMQSCYWLDADKKDYGHRVVILPPGESRYCLADQCRTPDELARFMAKVGAVGITAHPWRTLIVDPKFNEQKRDSLPAFLSRNYFDYRGNGQDDVWIGAEVGPDFYSISGQWALSPICEQPKLRLDTQTVTVPEWEDALANGKWLAAISSSDRHFDFIPFGLRTTVVFAKERSHQGIMEALRARRTLAAYMMPFNVELYSGSAMFGDTVDKSKMLSIKLDADSGSVEEMQLNRPGETIRSWKGDNAIGLFRIPAQDIPSGPVWVHIIGTEVDDNLHLQRTTITSPIWLK